MTSSRRWNRSRAFDQIDKCARERQRGITSTSPTWVPDRQASLRARRRPVTHDYIKNMITGAARWTRDPHGRRDRWPMPRTREHVLLARRVGVPHILVA